MDAHATAPAERAVSAIAHGDIARSWRRPDAAPAPHATRAIADLFCGLGGLGAGAVRALRDRGEDAWVLGINHWDTAVALHRRLFQNGHALEAPVDAVRPRIVVPQGRLDLLLAGPSCRSHSQARGWAALDDADRVPAFTVLDWCLALEVNAVLIENVPEFEEWGPAFPPSHPRAGFADPARRGEIFHHYLAGFRAAGYAVDYRVLRCADYGDPTGRRRLFVIGRRDGKPLRWPTATHGSASAVRRFGVQPWVTAREILDWDNPGVPIADKAHRLSPHTFRRIEIGLARFGDAFILPRRQHAMDDVRSVDRPLPTVLAGSTDLAVVFRRDGVVRHRALTVHELARAHSIPARTVRELPSRRRDAVRLIGNSVPQRTAAALAAVLLD